MTINKMKDFIDYAPSRFTNKGTLFDKPKYGAISSAP